MPPTNDPIIREMLAEQAYGSIYSAGYADAAKSARANETARKLGMDPGLVEAALPDMMAEERVRRTVDQARFNATFAQIMANTRLARVAADDPHMPTVAKRIDDHISVFSPEYIGMAATHIFGGLVGDTLSGLANYTRGIGEAASERRQRLQQVDKGPLSFVHRIPDPLEILGPIGRELAVTPDWISDHTQAQTGNPTKDAMLSGFRSVGSSLGALAATFATDNPAVGTTILAGSTGGLTYRQARQQGLGAENALDYGTADAAIEALTEFLPEKMFSKVVKGEGGGILRALGLNALTEIPGELVATAGQSFDQWLWQDRQKGQTFDQYLATLPEQEKQTLIAVLTTTAVLGPAGYSVGRYIRNQVDRQSATNVDRLMEAAAKSSTRQANPSDFEEALNQIVEGAAGDKLYVPADKVQELFQTDDGGAGKSIRDDPFWAPYADQVSEAAAMGGDLVIPLGTAATHLAGTQQWEQLKEHIRTRPGGLSIAEAREAPPPNFEQMAAEMAAKIDERLPQLAAERVTKDFATQLGYKGKQAKALTQLTAAALARAHAVENAKLTARGEEAVPLETFAQGYLPQALKTTQATYEKTAKGGALDQSAFHGSPHAFGKFSLEHVGRGEGHQAFGWGLYFTGKKEIAQHYRDTLTGSSVRMPDGTVLNAASMPFAAPEDQARRAAIQLLAQHTTIAKAKRATTSSNIRRELDALGKIGAKPNSGRLYHVEIPEDDEFLLWDKPLSEQPNKVKEALAKIPEKIWNRLGEALDDYGLNPIEPDDTAYTGRELYRALERDASEGELDSSSMGDNPQQDVSLFLRNLGIAGIKYLDGTSRSTGSGTHNYVVFDDNKVSISAYEQSFRDTHARGNISIQRDEAGLMSGAVIRAFESANFSTAVHELGHFFIEDLKRRATRGDAFDQEKADWETFRQWAESNGHKVGEQIPVEAHELWARGFERYIYEGKAPSVGLKNLFAMMRDFMMSLYRALSAFRSPINPQIREVMDRLLASEEEMARQREEMRLVGENLAGLMTESELQAYAELGDQSREAARDKLYERVLSALKTERDQRASERKAEIRSQVTEAHDAMPVFKALRLMRVGAPLEDGTTQRLSLPRQWLLDNYGEDIIDQLPKAVPSLVDDNHAVDPEYIASQAGFDSADQMIHALVENEAARQRLKADGDKRSVRQASIDAETERRVRKEIGDPYENLEEEAQAALANEKEADRLSLELRALARKTGRKATPWKMASDWAHGHIMAQASKNVLSGASLQMYARNASKAGRQVEEALVKSDYQEAFSAKQRQVLNLALLSRAKQIKDEVEKAVKRMQRTASRPTIRSVDQDYLDQAHQLLEAVDLKNRPNVQTEKRLAFEEWYQRQVQNGIEPVVPPEYQRLLGKTNWQHLPISQLLELDEAVSQVVKLGRLKQTLKDGQKSRDFNAAVAEMQGSGEQQPPRAKSGTTDPRRSLPGRARSWLRSVDAAMLKAETITTWLDGGDPNGPWTRMLFRPLADAQGRETDLLRTYINDINGLIKNLPKPLARSWSRVVDTPELVIKNRNHLNNGEAWVGTKDQVVMMAMNWGNSGNRQRLLDGFGWNEAAVMAVFDRVMTKEDWDFVQGVWDTVDKLWPEIEELERNVNGVAPEKVEATEVETPHGTYRGGYFPAVYDPTQSTRAAQDEADSLAPNGAWFTATTRASASKGRSEQVKGRPLLLSMSVITRHLGEVIHDVTHRQAVSQAKKVLTDPRIHSVISTRLGPEYAKAMGAWLENIARPNTAFSKDNPALIAIGRFLNKRVSLVGLGFRVTTSLVQLLGIPVAGGEIGSKYLAKGLAIAGSHPAQSYREMTARSAEMRARADTLDATIEDMVRDVARGKIQSIGPKGLQKYAFQGIVYMDMVVTTTVWTGAFNKGLDEGMTEEEAVHYADKVVRVTQGTGGMKDRSAIQNAHPMVRALYPFFSYMNALYNMQRDVFRRTAKAETVGGYAEAARRAWWVMLVPALLQALIFGGGPPDDDGEGATVGDWAAYLAKAAILGNIGSIPLIGNIAQAVGNGYTYRSNAYQQIGEGLVNGRKSAEKVISGDDELKGSTVKSVLTTLGLVTAQPLGQIGATAGGLYDYATGQAQPHSASDWYELLTKGRIPDNSTA